MPTKSEYIQNKVWRRFEKENGYTPASARTVAEWAVKQGLLQLPSVDPYDILAHEVARALRDESARDKHGRKYRVNHAVRSKGADGEQQTMWGIMGFAPRTHMETSFSQRREQIVGDCYHLKVDVDAYNGANPDAEPIQLVLDFTEDVAEREMESGFEQEAA